MAIKLVSVNIEQDKHNPRVIGFLAREKADVVALMEVYESDVKLLLKDYPYRVFAPNCQSFNGKMWGVAWGSKYPFAGEVFYADGKNNNEIPLHGTGTHRPVVVVIKFTIKGEEFRIGATHFTWTEGGKISDKQRDDFARLIDKYRGEEMILCGDFNLPRRNKGENEIYDMMSQIYKDNIPPEIVSTIDPLLHRANFEEHGKLALVVDYLWSCLTAGRRQPKYKVSEVRIETGVSDHCGVVCEISLENKV